MSGNVDEPAGLRLRDTGAVVTVPPPPAADVGFMNPAGVVRQGYIILILAAIGLTWAAIAPLESAIVAHGELVVKTHRKTIQHLEGGVVREILVADGQTVSAGQVLLRLDDVMARANLNLLQGEADALTAQEARLIAERDRRGSIQFPAELLARRGDPNVAAAMAGEVSAFRARSASVNQQVNVYGQRSEENDRTIDGLKSQREAVQQQAALIRQELASIEGLYTQGYVPISRLLALRRQAADLDGQDGQLAGRIAQIQAGSGENRLQGLSLIDQKLSDVVKDLRDVQTKRFDVLDRLHAAQDTLTRTTIVAPDAGIVVGLSVHTRGAVIKPGETVMEIVPSRDSLQVAIRVRPEDADHVRPGMTGRINFSSYRQRRLPIIKGVVETMSADRLLDEKGQPYFAADVTVDSSGLGPYPDARLMPGMPAEVEIDTGARTAFSYLTEPITDVFRHGLRER